jgi:hypothetical protein
MRHHYPSGLEGRGTLGSTGVAAGMMVELGSQVDGVRTNSIARQASSEMLVSRWSVVTLPRLEKVCYRCFLILPDTSVFIGLLYP